VSSWNYSNERRRHLFQMYMQEQEFITLPLYSSPSSTSSPTTGYLALK
jgi:hypothetical protein